MRSGRCRRLACTYRFAFGPRVDIDGFSLYASVGCGADDRKALEQLCRYITHNAFKHALAEFRPQIGMWSKLRASKSFSALRSSNAGAARAMFGETPSSSTAF